jgi:hypothetical protein
MMQAASVVQPGKSRRYVLISPAWLGVCALGAVIGVVGTFLKAFNVPAGIDYPYTNSVWSAASAGKGVVVLIVLTVVLLFLAIRRHRQRWLRVAYLTAFAALAWAASAAAAGFTLHTVGGGRVKVNAAVGPIVMTVGTAIMFISLLIARFTERRGA